MTFLEMQTEVDRRLQESGSSPAYWTLAQKKAALNDGYEEISDLTEWNETSQSVSLTTSTYYDLSSILTLPVLRVTRVFNAQTNRWLHPTDVREMDGTRRQWEDATGAPERWWIRGAWWLGLYPKAPTATGTVTVYHTAVPAALSADGDTPSFAQEYHLGLVEYACYDLLCQDREPQKALKYWARNDKRGNLVGGFLYHVEGLARYARQRDRFDRVMGYTG